MKLLERRMAVKNTPFSLGSTLDNDSAWQFEEVKTSSRPVVLKEPAKHLLVLKMEKRQGKPVSIVGPFFLAKEALTQLCSLVKKKLGSGGTCKEEWLEFQGECREKLKSILQNEGFRFKA
ncbi:translation initiation factor [Sulfurospirillum barnesii]|uniref:Translation initiation factor eIF-1/SUI1-like protein n=1 Tax=Sulfurospirillum barnesii (strain ATCC 700032 / DSM 10660 / SES-3) TaxID=760154 RepID=I3XYN0_SULBS|nr:translation initiation factor [Sulfurospirillum barnesii]AFL69054.1 translation initiation factor eIF-1/SUI1-like protein [Sulfurospirillum barnesii SES-3]